MSISRVVSAVLYFVPQEEEGPGAAALQRVGGLRIQEGGG